MQYRIADPYLYLFKVRNLEGTSRRHERGDHARGGRRPGRLPKCSRWAPGIESLVQGRLQDLANQYEMGITIDQVVLQDVKPAGSGEAVVGMRSTRPSSSATG